MSLSVKRLVQFGSIISEGFETNFEVMVNEDDNLDESKPSEIINFQTIFLNDFLIGKRINRMMTVSERPNFYDRAMSYATNAFEILSKLSNIAHFLSQNNEIRPLFIYKSKRFQAVLTSF